WAGDWRSSPFGTESSEDSFVGWVESSRPTWSPNEFLGRGGSRRLDPPYGLSRLRGQVAGRNILVICLESAGAQYLRQYGAAEDPMPHLTALAPQSLLFENAYTAYPETIRSFFAVQCATWPALDTGPEDYERLAAPGIAQVLLNAGYRAGLFHS